MEFPRQPTIVIIRVESGHREDTYNAKLAIKRAINSLGGIANVDTTHSEDGLVATIRAYPFAVND